MISNTEVFTWSSCNFQLQEHWPCEPIRVQNSKILHLNSAFWLDGTVLTLAMKCCKNLKKYSMVEEVVVFSSSSWLGISPTDLACPFLTGCCFQSPSVVVLITGLPDNLRWVLPPLHTQPQLSGSLNWGNNSCRLLSAVSDLVLPWHKVQRVLAKHFSCSNFDWPLFMWWHFSGPFVARNGTF